MKRPKNSGVKKDKEGGTTHIKCGILLPCLVLQHISTKASWITMSWTNSLIGVRKKNLYTASWFHCWKVHFLFHIIFSRKPALLVLPFSKLILLNVLSLFKIKTMQEKVLEIYCHGDLPTLRGLQRRDRVSQYSIPNLVLDLNIW
jgi:hypothetical protein